MHDRGEGHSPDFCCGACAFAAQVAASPEPPRPLAGELVFALEPSGAPVGAVLEIAGPGAPRAVPVARARLTVGRGLQTTRADIGVEDATLSRVQCSFDFSSGGVLVSDEQSACGTYVNGHVIHAPPRLRAGDKVLVGNTTLVVRPR